MLRMTHRTEEITSFMLSTFEQQGWLDDPETRLAFLEGLQAGWNEPDPDDDTLTTEEAFEKSLYKLALWGMILNLKTQLRFKEATPCNSSENHAPSCPAGASSATGGTSVAPYDS